MALREMLLETFVHMPPVKMLEGLSATDAARRPGDGVHSIVEILAHVNFWQTWWLNRCDGRVEPMVAAAKHGWPDAAAADWPRLCEEFTAGLHHAVALSEDGARLDIPITPAIEFPPLSHHTIRDGLMHVAQHNAHHLGQIVIVRQLIGQWPPPQGSWTW